VSTFSVTAHELRAVCRAALGCDLRGVRPIGVGRNSRVFVADLACEAASLPDRVVVKFYRQDASDARDRLGTEFESLRFLWQNHIRVIPRPLVLARDWRCGVYEYIPGDVASSGAIGPDDVDCAVDFLRALMDIRAAPGAGALPDASEACFALRDLVANVDGRADRLRRAPEQCDEVAAMRHWLNGPFRAAQADIVAWCRVAADAAGVAFDDPIGRGSRTLSPSDFGFHNAIRRADGTLAFVDFEYFGWDDPAKTIADFLLHPGMVLDDATKRRFASRMGAAFADVSGIGARARIVYPLFGLKWAMILLNDFLPERFAQSTADRRRAQLVKAEAIVARVAREYADNPYLSSTVS
jgi:Phosphotransferase enzyme family